MSKAIVSIFHPIDGMDLEVVLARVSQPASQPPREGTMDSGPGLDDTSGKEGERERERERKGCVCLW